MLLNSLGRVLVASGFVAVTSFMASTAAFAQVVVPALDAASSFYPPSHSRSTTATVVVKGRVNTTLDIKAVTLSSASDINLDPHQTGTKVKVADLFLGTNNWEGLTVATTGALSLATAQGHTSVPFSVAIAPGNPAASTTTGYVGANNDVFSTGAAAFYAPHSLYIQYTTDPQFQDPGQYEGAINLNVRDK